MRSKVRGWSQLSKPSLWSRELAEGGEGGVDIALAIWPGPYNPISNSTLL